MSLLLFTRKDGAPVAVARDMIALAVPALAESGELILGATVLLPTRDVVSEPLDDIAQAAGLAVFESVDGKRVGIAPGAVGHISTEPGMIGTAVIALKIPGLKPLIARTNVTDAAEYLNRVEAGEAPKPPSILVTK